MLPNCSAANRESPDQPVTGWISPSTAAPTTSWAPPRNSQASYGGANQADGGEREGLTDAGPERCRLGNFFSKTIRIGEESAENDMGIGQER